jgi:hypothetical protein
MKLEISKGECHIILSEGKLVLTCCEPPELGRTLHPFILGPAAFEGDYNTKDDKA